MKDDVISAIARSDSIIITYGERLYEKHATEPHLRNMISGKMRELARLVDVSNKQEGSCSMNWKTYCNHVSLTISSIVLEF